MPLTNEELLKRAAGEKAASITPVRKSRRLKLRKHSTLRRRVIRTRSRPRAIKRRGGTPTPATERALVAAREREQRLEEPVVKTRTESLAPEVLKKLKGEKGDRGEPGESIVGPTGKEGATGREGKDGDRGKRGEPGKQGPPGKEAKPGSVEVIGAGIHGVEQHGLPRYGVIIGRDGEGNIESVQQEGHTLPKVEIQRDANGDILSVTKRRRKVTILRNPDGSVAGTQVGHE